MALENMWASDQIADQIFNDLTLIGHMEKPGNTVSATGGDHIIVPLMYAKNTTAKAYRGSDTLDVTPQDLVTSARFDWKQVAVSVVINGLEQLANGGPHQIKDILKTRLDNAKLSAKDKMNYYLFRDGTDESGKAPSGLDLLVPEGGAGTVGGIASGTYTWWKSKSKSAVGSFAANGFSELAKFILSCSKNRKSGYPTLILGTELFYAYFEAALQAKQQVLVGSSQAKADAGFAPLVYKGIDIEWDSDMPQDSGSKEKAYVLNTRYLKLYQHRDRNFKPGKFKEPPDQDHLVSQLLWAGELITNCRRHQGVFYGVEE